MYYIQSIPAIGIKRTEYDWNIQWSSILWVKKTNIVQEKGQRVVEKDEEIYVNSTTYILMLSLAGLH